MPVRFRGKEDYPIFYFREGKERLYPIKIHHLAALCFYGEGSFLPGLQVRHLDGNRLNIRISNIKFGTQKDNENDKSDEALSKCREALARGRASLERDEYGRFKSNSST